MFLYRAQLFYEDWHTLPWWLLSEEQYIDTTAGEERVPLPIGFLREFEPTSLWRYDSTATEPYLPLIKKSLGPITSAMGDELSASGPPTHYALTNGYFILRPVPDAAYRIKMRSYNRDAAITTLTDTQSNDWLRYAPNLLIARAVYRLAAAAQMSSKQLIAYRDEWKEQERAYHTNIEARDHANRRYQQGVA